MVSQAWSTSSDISVYMKRLFHAQSAAEYDSLLQTVKQDWDASFVKRKFIALFTALLDAGFWRLIKCIILTVK